MAKIARPKTYTISLSAGVARKLTDSAEILTSSITVQNTSAETVNFGGSDSQDIEIAAGGSLSISGIDSDASGTHDHLSTEDCYVECASAVDIVVMVLEVI